MPNITTNHAITYTNSFTAIGFGTSVDNDKLGPTEIPTSVWIIYDKWMRFALYNYSFVRPNLTDF